MFTDIQDLHKVVSWRNRKDKRGVYEPRAVVMRGAKPRGIFIKGKSPNAGNVINATKGNIAFDGKGNIMPKELILP